MTPRPQNPDRLRYAIYARTAARGPEQIQTQVRAARAAIARHGRGRGAAINEYLDLNVAGGSGTPGPGLCSLLRDAAAGLFDVVVVTDLTRLSRSAARLREIVSAFELGGVRVAWLEAPR